MSIPKSRLGFAGYLGAPCFEQPRHRIPLCLVVSLGHFAAAFTEQVIKIRLGRILSCRDDLSTLETGRDGHTMCSMTLVVVVLLVLIKPDDKGGFLYVGQVDTATAAIAGQFLDDGETDMMEMESFTVQGAASLSVRKKRLPLRGPTCARVALSRYSQPKPLI